MRVTVDRVGRIVIPKPLRDSLGIVAESELEVTAEAGGLRIECVVVHERVVETSDGFPRLRAIAGHRLTDADVTALRDELQR